MTAAATNVHRVRVIGQGRAGRSFASALSSVGVDVDVIGRTGLADAASDVDLVLICVPDDAIADVAGAIEPGSAVVAHCSGSRTLDVLAPHERRCSIHPLMSLPDADVGAARLLGECRFAIAGDPVALAIVQRLGGIALQIADADRARYHAGAAIASNHLVALCAEVERIAAQLDVDPAGFWALMQTTLDNVVEHGAAAALTGPASRGDVETLRAHLDALEPAQHGSYLALARVAAELAGRTLPDDLDDQPTTGRRR